MAASGAEERRQRRGPAPIASFDHDVSDESSPETKQPPRLPEILEDPGGGAANTWLTAGETRARSHSTPAVGGLPAPRIDISRASSSSHQDSRDSSPDLALFAGSGGEESRARLELGFREDGALDLRSSTEELAFLEGAPGETRPPPPPPPPPARRHSRKDSQGSEAALLAVSGRTSRLSSVGSQCSAHSALSRLSVASGVSRSPSPHKMLLETSFCGPRPIETDPEICAAAVEERLLEIAKMTAPPDSRDRREVCAEVTVEIPRLPPAPPASSPAPRAPSVTPASTPAPAPALVPTASPEDDKRRKETTNRVRVEERRARPRLRREPSEPEVYKSRNRTKDVIRIKLKPDEDYGEEEEVEHVRPHPELIPTSTDASASVDDATAARAVRPTELVGRPPLSPVPVRRPAPRESRTPSPAGPPVSRKSSFCSLFKSRETIASPDSPSQVLRRKRSLTEGGGRSKSRDRSATPTSASKIRGSVLSLFRTPRRSVASLSPSTREGSPVVQPQRPQHDQASLAHATPPTERLRYYEDTGDGIIHIPLRTPPDEPHSMCRGMDCEPGVMPSRNPARPASAPVPRTTPEPGGSVRATSKPIQRTVLPDGSIIIPLHSPTERATPVEFSSSPPREVELAEPNGSPADIVAPEVPPAGSRVAADGAEASPARERCIDGAPDSVPTVAATDEQFHRRQKEQVVFTTHVGSRDQLFSTQFSITKTPSIASEISGSFPSSGEGEEAQNKTRGVGSFEIKFEASAEACDGDVSPQEHGEGDEPRDSSGSEPSSEAGGAGAPRAGSEVERRGLVIQDSFEEELPYVPTTLPLERPVALPMVPVRERGGVRTASLQRPRATPPPALAPRPRAPPPPAPAPPADKLRIRLPRRPRLGVSRPRTRSGGDGAESRPKEWIDFEEVPERRKQPKRIQTLPASASIGSGADTVAGAQESGGALAGVVFSYVEPEQCRCECHGHARASDMLRSDSLEDEVQGAQVELSVHIARPFTADFDLNSDPHFSANMSSPGSTRH